MPFSFSSTGGSGTPGPQGEIGPAGADGADGADALWNFLGEWENGIDYAAGSVVQFQGSSYYHPDGQFSSYSPPGYGWLLVSAKGDSGADGSSTDTYDILYTTHNSDGTNVKIGDDAWIGDVDEANHISIQGVQDSSKGGIVFGDNETEKIASDGTNLTLNANNDIILYPASAYAYIGTPQIDGSNRIATWDYVSTVGATTATYTPNWTGTGLAYTGTPAVGSYVKIGNLVTFHIQVTLTNVSNFGTGQYFITLPFAPIGDYAFRDGGLHVAGNHYTVMADAEAGTTSMDLWYVAGTGQDMPMNHNSPHTLTTTSKFYINGTYITSN